MAKVDFHCLLPYSTTKALRELSLKINISMSVLLEHGIKLLLKEKLNENIPAVNFDRIINDMQVQEKLRQQIDIIRVATLFENTVERIHILKNNLAPYETLVEFIKREIEILNLYLVDKKLKKSVLKLFKSFLIGLKHNKKDYRNHIGILYDKLSQIKKNIVYLRFDKNNAMVQKTN